MSFYAEFLHNIKTISLSITLSVPVSASTRATLAPDGLSILLHNGHYSMTIDLPAPAKVTSQTVLDNIPQGKTSLALRLPAAANFPAVDSENYTPWSAADLSARKSTVSFNCRACNRVLIAAGQVKQWKDLPSEGWAEMMDFWHCHKPPPDSHVDGSKGEGKYTAFEKGYDPKPGTALVQGGYFLLSSKDCTDIKVLIDGKSSANRLLICNVCAAPVGSIGISTSAITTRTWRIDKWNLRLNNDGREIAHPLESFLAARLIAIAEDEGIRRIYVTCEQAKTAKIVPGLKLWLFSSDMRYTCTGISSSVRGIKVLFQPSKQSEIVATNSFNPTGYESLVLVPAEYNKLQRLLEDSNKLFPAEIGAMMGWRVGALRRFEIRQRSGHGY